MKANQSVSKWFIRLCFFFFVHLTQLKCLNKSGSMFCVLLFAIFMVPHLSASFHNSLETMYWKKTRSI